MSFEQKKLNIRNEIIDDIIERKSNGVSPLLEKKRIASRFNLIRNTQDLLYFGALPLLFFIYTKRTSGRMVYCALGGAYFASYFGLGLLKKIKYEETKMLFAASDSDFEEKCRFYASVVRDKYDPYEALPRV
jgi:hypothetical protein